MNNRNPKRPNILFLFSDTGGGHRSAAEAIIEGLTLQFGDTLSTEMLDFFKTHAPEPFNRFPALYPYMVRVPQAWGLSYHLSDGPRRVNLINETAWPVVRHAAENFAAYIRQADLIVSVHPVVNAPALRALGPNRPPFVTVVTDMVTTHAMWYNPQVDLCIVPTEAAYQRALKYGMRSDQVKVIGLPVAHRFCHTPTDQTEAAYRQALRSRLGWTKDLPLILLVGGGEGMGPLEQMTAAIADAGLTAVLVVVAGRNRTLKARLEARRWPIPVHVYGFVREMPDFMRAADVLVTKAGPGTICEAFNAGLPMILYSRLPGQEDGNVSYVVSEGAGVWAPEPRQVVAVLRDWLDHPEKRQQAVRACQRVARPRASREIAYELGTLVGMLEPDDK